MSHLRKVSILDTVGFMNYIERLRYSRGMSQEEFLFEIISPRQYQRYRNGVSSVPIECIEKMSNKLGVETRKLYMDYDQAKLNEKELVEDFYNSTVYQNLERIKELQKFFTSYVFLDHSNKEIFELAVIFNQYLLKNISKFVLLENVTSLINYPELLSFSVLRDIEIIGLLLIYQYSIESRTKIISTIKELNKNQELYLSGQSYFVLVMFLYYIALDYGKKEDYVKVEEYCLKGINLVKKKHSDYCLYLFYYQLASSHFCRNNDLKFKETLYKCIVQVESMHKPELKKQVYNKVKTFFNIDANQFFLEHIKNDPNRI